MSPQRLLPQVRHRPLRRGESGRGLVRLTPLVAVAVLLLNDHVLKAAIPGLLTGKLSDIAGLVFFPLVIVAATELVASAAGRPIQRPGRVLILAVVLTGLAFALIKVLPIATALWAGLLGTAGWPFAVVLAVASHGPIPPWAAVATVTDPTDLIALPALLLAWIDGRRRFPGSTGRSIPEATRIRSSLLPIGALIVAGLASLATSPATGTPTNVDLVVRVELTAEHPVAIQAFDLTVDASAIEGSMNTRVTLTSLDTRVRYVVVSGDQQARTGLPMGGATASLSMARCAADPCTRVVSLITELVDRSTSPFSAETTLHVAAEPSTPNEQLESDRISFVERGEPRLQGPPSVVRGELSGEDTIGPADPVVEHHIAVHRDPAGVSDPSRFVLDGRLRLEASGAPASVVLNMGTPKLDQVTGESSLERPSERELPGFGACVNTVACDGEYVVRLTAGVGMAAPSVVRWRIVLEMIDYDAATAPDGRMITAELTDTKALGASPVTIRQTVRGRYQAMRDRDAPYVPYVVTLDPSVTTLADGTPRQLLVTQIMTISGVEADGPRTHERPALHLRLGRVGYVGGSFDADGQAHAFRRYDLETCEAACQQRFEFNVYLNPDGVATPVWLDWTIEIEVTAWGDPPLPSDAAIEVEVLPAKATD